MQSATCGIIQFAGDDNSAYHILTDIANGDSTDFNRTLFDNIDLLKKSCSLLIDFLLAEDIHIPKKNHVAKRPYKICKESISWDTRA